MIMDSEINQDKIEERAKKLGRAIGQTDLVDELNQALENLRDSDEAYETFQKVQNLQQELNEKVEQGQDIAEEKKEELGEAMNKLENYSAYRRFAKAQATFSRFMEQVDQYIQHGIDDGQDSNIIEV